MSAEPAFSLYQGVQPVADPLVLVGDVLGHKWLEIKGEKRLQVSFRLEQYGSIPRELRRQFSGLYLVMRTQTGKQYEMFCQYYWVGYDRELQSNVLSVAAPASEVKEIRGALIPKGSAYLSKIGSHTVRRNLPGGPSPVRLSLLGQHYQPKIR